MRSEQCFVSSRAVIGKDVVIGPFSSIGDDVEIGDGTWIGANVTIMDGARIRKKCQIYPGAVISAPPQDMKYRGEASTATIGENTVIRECVTINRGTALDRNDTRIGSNCLLMAYVHVAHDCVIGDHVILSNMVQLAGHVVIGDYAFFGGVSAVHQFVKVGVHTMISGGSLVRKDVPPYITASREPLSYSGVNSAGLKRRGFKTAQIDQIQEIYRVLYQSGLNTSDALKKLVQADGHTPQHKTVIDFISHSNRGIIRGPSDN